MKRYYIYLLAFIIIAISSCKKDFLEVTDGSNLNRQNYVNSLQTMEEFLNGIYVTLAGRYEDRYTAVYPELIADNIKPLAVPPQSLMAHYNWSQQAVEDNSLTVGDKSLSANGIWAQCYAIIRSCNFVIEDVDQYRKDNPEKADYMKGQAYAIRALLHFRLVNVFAQPYTFSADASHDGVPYITASDISASFTRQNVSTVYDRIIADYEKAIELMPATTADIRYMNQAAAKALLARAYLFKEDFAAANSLATEVAGKYPLMTVANGYPNDLFKNKPASQTESLFQLTPDRTNYSVNFANAFYRLYVQFYATSDIAVILKENANDARKAWVTNSSGNWSITKFPNGVAAGITPAEYAYYPAVIRSSEMFLTAAEASAKLGDENTARTYLNAVRKRADVSAPSVTATGAALLDSVYKERRKELSFESLRIFDLQRWKRGVHRTDIVTGAGKDISYPNDKLIAPIPLQDVKLAGIPQNAGY